MPILDASVPAPPAPWHWYRQGTSVVWRSLPHFRSNQDEDVFAELFEQLRVWAEEHNVLCYRPTYERFYTYFYDRQPVEREFYNDDTGEYEYEVVDGEWTEGEPWHYECPTVRHNWPMVVRVMADDENGGGLDRLREEGFTVIDFAPVVCRCGHENPYGSMSCRNADCATILRCGNCDAFGPADYDTTEGWSCGTCGPVCAAEGCDTFARSGRCGLHSFRYRCGNCGPATANSQEELDALPIYERPTGSPEAIFEPVSNSNMRVCATCQPHYCVACRRFPGQATMLDWTDDDGTEHHTCRNCRNRHFEMEQIDEEAEMTNRRLALPTIPGREMIRTCGVEIEGATGTTGVHAGNYLASQLYEAGLSDRSEMGGYHSRDSGFAKIERDSSVDWELVVGPLNMANNREVAQLNKTVRVIRKAIKEKHASFDLRCGLHIHVSAEKVGLGKAYNLHVLFAYLEDLLYRLGAARWPMHRAIANDDDHYCKIGPKQPGKVRFARTYQDDRYFGLSFINYFQKMLGECECGAGRFGVFEECRCTLRKCTFEFRLFNTTANTRKLHAYLALTQALVAKAISMPDLSEDDEYPEMLFRRSRFAEMSGTEQEEISGKWETRLRWLVQELPLTEDELASLRYCVEHSELSKLGEQVMDEIFHTNTTEEVAA